MAKVDAMPREGEEAPDFTLPSTDGKATSLRALRGRPVVLYFYPKDDTPGCTREACGFRDNLPRLTGLDAKVLGVSMDEMRSHEKFSTKYGLPFPLLSDVEGKVSRAYGVYGKKNMYGREVWGIRRTTFIIDREGRISKVFPGVKVDGHTEEVLQALKALG